MPSDEQDQLLRLAFSHRDKLVGYAYGLTRDWSLAHDAFQEALISLHHKIAEIDAEKLFFWLKRVTRNKAVDIIRKHESVDKTHQRLIDLVEMHFDERLDDDYQEKKSLEAHALYSCMQKLRSEARDLLIAFYRDRLSCVELTDTFQRSENALRLLLSRSRSSLKSCIKKEVAES